ncbi:hypothetical protein B5807_12040 [Epicoccum nigrum]|uniref:Uncharacterized protein n=1 Tax=Epicoccum nigrum TaxID=105696 RepID=A0A1Y2LH31_EPING|nr:hypothetical protein B5807_12040 [Epicoccum nigrum]
MGTDVTLPSVSGDNTGSAYVKIAVASGSDTEATVDRESTVLAPSYMYKMLDNPSRRTSLSLSYWSDIWSLIDRRMSLSTFTSSRRSGSATSFAETEFSYTTSRSAEIMETMWGTIRRANFALAQFCCARSTDCRHRLIFRVSEKDPHLVTRNKADFKSELTAMPVQQPPKDSCGNSELFFAARGPTGPDILLSLLSVTEDVNTVNADGQTFLYFLDAQYFGFSDSLCSFLATEIHRSRLECFICALERRQYKFDHLDNHGRHFLMYLCASSHFDLRWLLQLMLTDHEWNEGVKRVSQLREVGGTFLLNFVTLHPGFEILNEQYKSLFRPLYSFSPHLADQFDVLHNEDRHGRSRFHQYVQGDWLLKVPQDEVAWPFLGGLPLENVCDINEYDGHGRTPIMDFLLRAFDTGLEEDFICAKVKALLKGGANVNARSRGGSTVLHFAAKKAMPRLLELLLNTDIQVDHCDEAGMSALDYAAKVLQRSRSAKSRVEVMARFLKTTAQLLSVTSQIRPRDRGAFDQRSSRDIEYRAQRNVEQLSSPREQRYPPSFPVAFPRRRE